MKDATKDDLQFALTVLIFLVAFVLTLCLPGCDGVRVEVDEDAVTVKPGAVDVKPDAVGHVEVKPNAVKVEKDAVLHVETSPGTIHGAIARGALHVDRVMDARGAVAPGAITGRVEAGAVPLTFADCGKLNIAEGAVQVRPEVCEGAVQISLNLKIEPGAVVVRGAEVGTAVDLSGSHPWGWIAGCGLLAVWGIVCKVRRHAATRGVGQGWVDVIA